MEILAVRYFGGLLKLRHLMEFTLAIEQILAIMIFIATSNALGIEPGRELILAQLG